MYCRLNSRLLAKTNLCNPLIQTPFRALHQFTRIPSPISFSHLSSQTFNTSKVQKRNYSGTILRTVKKDEVGVIYFDTPDAKVNTLSEKVLNEFGECLKELNNDPSVKALVIISGKKDNFIAGADINMLGKCTTSDEFVKLSMEGKVILNQMQNGKPTVAAIHGSCLGGGLEVALACHYRIATSSSKTSLGLPEVMLGLLPGAGGCVRLPRLIGIPNSLDLILTGRSLKADKAKKLGLVDEVVDPYALERSAIEAARDFITKKDFSEKYLKRSKSGMAKYMSDLQNSAIGKAFIFRQAASMLKKKDPYERYPSPKEILSLLQSTVGIEQGKAEELEAQSFGRVGVTPESKSLIHIFHGQTACKKNPYPDPAKPVKTIGVLGAGLMGAGITQVSIQSGHDVLLKDMDTKGISRGLSQIQKNLSTDLKKRKISLFDFNLMESRILPLTNNDANWGQHFKKADMVIEAVFESMEVKHKVVRELEEFVPEHCVIATNTSALPIIEISSASKRPENIVGLHYFSPVEKMPLLEIISTPKTSQETLSKAFAVGLKQGKTPILVKDVPGFYVNRCLGPFMVEVMILLLRGVDPLLIDEAMVEFGFPVGPLSLADEVGLDVAYHVFKYLQKHLPTRMEGGVELIEAIVQKGLLGKKTGQGFFVHNLGAKGKKKEINPEVLKAISSLSKSRLAVDKKGIQDRIAGRFINEAAFCLQDGIIANPSDGDIGAVFGIGFPPFRGGPFHYIDQIGANHFVDTMNRLRDESGTGFEPAPILVSYAKEGKKFFPKN